MGSWWGRSPHPVAESIFGLAFIALGIASRIWPAPSPRILNWISPDAKMWILIACGAVLVFHGVQTLWLDRRRPPS